VPHLTPGSLAVAAGAALAVLFLAPSIGCQGGVGQPAGGVGGAATGGRPGPTSGAGGSAGTAPAGDPDAGPSSPPDAAADRGARDTGPASAADAPAGWRLVWSDEFSVDGAPDTTSWRYENGFVRNQELQWYQPGNATVRDGLLVIEARREQVANPRFSAGSSDWKVNRQFAQYTSTSMTTSGRHAFMYGRFEMRARIPTPAGSWPAFWILGSGTAWPQSGEVDIMEYYNSRVLANVCVPMAASGGDCLWTSKFQTLSQLGAGWANDFHVWAMEWDAQKVDLFLDDKLVNHFVVPGAVGAGITNPYTTKSMYILLNLAIGGTAGGDPSATTFPIRYEVDYVRVYQR
jgi:beta-glucanase (GH16 family)